MTADRKFEAALHGSTAADEAKRDTGAYRPRKPPSAEEVDYDDETGVIVLRTHDVAVADALAHPLLAHHYGPDPDDMPEGQPIYVKRVPWCPTGCSGHDWHWVSAPQPTRGYTPAVEYRP